MCQTWLPCPARPGETALVDLVSFLFYFITLRLPPHSAFLVPFLHTLLYWFYSFNVKEIGYWWTESFRHGLLSLSLCFSYCGSPFIKKKEIASINLSHSTEKGGEVGMEWGPVLVLELVWLSVQDSGMRVRGRSQDWLVTKPSSIA